MWTNAALQRVGNNDPYTDEQGTRYGFNFPKNEIAGLFTLTETRPNTTQYQRAIYVGIEQDGEGNYQEVWEVEDFTQEEIDAAYAATIPEAVLMRQARYALLGAGMLPAVEGFLAAMPEGNEKVAAYIEWNTSQTVRRDNPLVAAAAASLGLTQANLDTLFLTAAQIV